ncbi:hypothetical protein HXX76_013125 [Chlamydomonas incerta]|uniref:Methyltransferase type 11 domain-containing protein n=1 Tax=Chlamydomonas incerta TaxID=51695 RepID=A0A835SFP4_CHLIN|nr:hypothetical protein HXX76_013125 [Chlamydomonas incerta]|eukprot:KAG2426368.1 hypothetical protein HXX76_013125 [Chlamydomonas incerta]
MADVAEQRALRLQNVRYDDREYWNSRYTNQPCEFDWFYGYTALRKVVRQFVKRSKLVLHVGCGNSNFQEGMANDGYQLVNTDISEVVIDQMRKKHADVTGLRYVVSDCREMPEFLDCQFGSVIDKGTVDALLCSKDAGANINAMFREISRVLIPGGTFLLITLGGPAHRLPLVNRPEFGWSVQVCLVRRVPDSQFAPSEPGRAIPLNDTPKPLSFIGPLQANADGSVDGLPDDFEPAHFFYAYACRKAPLVLGGTAPADAAAGPGAGAGAAARARAGPAAGDPAAEGAGGRVRLPEGWCNTVRAVAQVIRGELGLPPGILGRGRRVRTTTRASFERQQREREAQAAAASGATPSAAAAQTAATGSGTATAMHEPGALNGNTGGAAAYRSSTAVPMGSGSATPLPAEAGSSPGAGSGAGAGAMAGGVPHPGQEAAAAASARAGDDEAAAEAEQQQQIQQLLDPLGGGSQAAWHVHASALDEAVAQVAAAAHPQPHPMQPHHHHHHQRQGLHLDQGGLAEPAAGSMGAGLQRGASSSALAIGGGGAEGAPGGGGAEGGSETRGGRGERPRGLLLSSDAAADAELLVVVDDGTCSAPQLDLHGLHEPMCGAAGGWAAPTSDSMAALFGQLQLQQQQQQLQPQQLQLQQQALSLRATVEAGAQAACTGRGAPGAAGAARGTTSSFGTQAAVVEPAAAEPPGPGTNQPWARQQALQQQQQQGGGGGGGAISFRRLSITVSDAFEVLDKVDGVAGSPHARWARQGAEPARPASLDEGQEEQPQQPQQPQPQQRHDG